IVIRLAAARGYNREVHCGLIRCAMEWRGLTCHINPATPHGGNLMSRITRRTFVATSTAIATLAPPYSRIAQPQAPSAPPPGPFKQPPLPFHESALAPTISARTVTLHYSLHGATYFNSLNTLTKDTKYASMSLEQVVVEANKETDRRIYNNASQ